MNLISGFRLQLNPTHPDVIALTGAGGKTSTLFRLAGEIVAAGKRVVTTTTTRISVEQMAQSPVHLPVVDASTRSSVSSAVDWTRLEQILGESGQCLLVTSVEGPKALGIDPVVVDELARRAADLSIAAILNEADGSRRRPVKAPATHEPAVPDSTTLLVPVMGLDGVGMRLDDDSIHRPEQVRSVLGVADPGMRLTPEMAARLLIDPAGGAKAKPAGARLLPLLNKADNAPRLASGRSIARQLATRGYAVLLGTVGLAGSAPIRERWGPVAAVVLAAGESRRMGKAKQLLAVNGEPLVVRAVRIALESGATEVLVVTGAHGDAVQAVLQSSASERLRIVHNQAWTAGQSTSVRVAMDALSSQTEAVLFLPVDQPNLPVPLLRRMWQLWRSGADRVAPTVDGELRGAPAIFDRIYWPELCLLEGDRGARPLLKKQSAGVATIATPAHWLQDVDTPDDWVRFQQ